MSSIKETSTFVIYHCVKIRSLNGKKELTHMGADVFHCDTKADAVKEFWGVVNKRALIATCKYRRVKRKDFFVLSVRIRKVDHKRKPKTERA